MDQNSPLIVYGHAACPAVGPVVALLKQAHVPFTYVDIHHDPAAAAQVRALNHGNESVPTLVFPDHTHLTEPSVAALQAKLHALGYRVGVLAWLAGHAWQIVIAAGVIVAVLRMLRVF